MIILKMGKHGYKPEADDAYLSDFVMNRLKILFLLHFTMQFNVLTLDNAFDFMN